jgi:hypothetical protein
MVLDSFAIATQIAGFAVFFWLGLYMLVRAQRRTPLIVASVLGFASQALFFACGVLAESATDRNMFIIWQRLFLLVTCLPSAAWLHVAIAMHPLSRRTPLRQVLIGIGYVAALLLGVLGAVTEAFVQYSAVSAIGAAFQIPIGRYYLIMVGLVTLMMLAALMSIGTRWVRAPQARADLTLLIAGGVAFLIGVIWLASSVLLSGLLPVAVGYVFLLAGAALLGIEIAAYGLLLDGQQIRRDVLYSFCGVLLLNLLYLLLIGATTTLAPSTALVVTGLVTASHVLFDQGRRLLDRFFFSPVEQSERAEARAYAETIVTVPAEPELLPEVVFDKAFQNQVRQALTGLQHPPRLAQSPLLTLPLVHTRITRDQLEDVRLNRVAALRAILIEHIEALRPNDGVAYGTSDAWRFYNVLYYPYVRGVSRANALIEARNLEQQRKRHGLPTPDPYERTLDWLADVDENTFYKWQRRASDTIALALFEQNREM